MERERKVDLNTMSVSEVDVLSTQVGNKVREICDEANSKANALLNIYGAKCKIVIEIEELPQIMANPMGLTKPKRKPYKKANLKK
jgi:hypothetical protein